MKPENAIEVRGVTKKFRVYPDKGRTLKEKTLFAKRRKYEEHTVLNGIDFEVKKGEAIGLIGQNGCGKSTILKLLTKIMYPDSGSIEMCGRVSSLLELGAGFHPDMSGRENIYINASIFGLTKKEIEARALDIISFSELEEYIDCPVRTYSSGMYMRLAFAVAIHVDADILLIDEILAVGDAYFQAKCFNRLREIKREGTTIVLVSHSHSQIEQLCKKSIWIHEGKVWEYDLSGTVVEHYLEYMGEKHKKQPDAPEKVQEKEEEKGQESITEYLNQGNSNTHICKVSFVKNGREIHRIKCGESVNLEIEYTAKQEDLDDPLIGLKFFCNDGVVCYGTNTQREGIRNLMLRQQGRIVCKIEKMNLVAGKYWIDVALRNCNMMPLDYAEKSCVFEMYSSVDEIGIVRLDHKWEIC